MKKTSVLLAGITLFLSGLTMNAQEAQRDTTFRSHGNPVFTHKYTADPAALVHDGKFYVYAGHDETPENREHYVLNQWLVFSTEDMVNWTEHPVPLKVKDIPWAKGEAWAAQVIERDGKFYWYVTAEHKDIKGKAIGVAVSDSPTGPFVSTDKALITNDMTTQYTKISWEDIDPTVFIDDDGQAYMFWGNTQCYYIKLKENMIETEGDIVPVFLPKYTEAPWIHKHNGWYYLSYASGFPEKLSYAMSRKITGPWIPMGEICGVAGYSNTIHQAMVEYKDQWYCVYHNGSINVNGGFKNANGSNMAGSSYRRSVCIDKFEHNTDGSIRPIQMTKQGVSSLERKVSWDSQDAMNVMVPGYFADPTMVYDDKTDSFYMYATSDGRWIAYSRDPHVAVSKDLVNWEYKPVVLPDFYPVCTPESPNKNRAGVWAPTAFKHPKNGKFYLGYQVNLEFYVMMSESPLGPWRNATADNTTEGAPILKNKQQWGHGDAFDAQFFVDNDGEVYITFGGHRGAGIMKTKFDENGIMYPDNNDPRFTDGTAVKYKRITDLPEYLEGSVMMNVDGTYYLSYSCDASQNYKVRYATAKSPAGPFYPAAGYIISRDNENEILGPGHHEMFKFDNDWYIVYHRQHYPMVDAKRQVCIDRIYFHDGEIVNNVQSHSGISKAQGALESRYQAAKSKQRVPVSLGKPAIASSVSDYKGGTVRHERFESVPEFYKAGFITDNNYATRWQSAKEVGEPAWVIIDLEKDTRISDTEVFFEYTIYPYNYTIEYLPAKAASTVEEAAKSSAWRQYAKGESISPARNKKNVTARYMKLNILDVKNLPRGEEYRGCDGQDYENRPSVWEFKVY